MPDIEIRRFLPHEWRVYRQIRMRALADSPYAFGSTLAEAQARTDADWQSRFCPAQSAPLEYPLLALVDDQPAGLAWGHIHPLELTVAHLFQMWVDPQFRRLHLGELLVNAVVDWARNHRVAYVELDVATGNPAALALYRKCGFLEWGQPHPLRTGMSMLSQTMRLQCDK